MRKAEIVEQLKRFIEVNFGKDEEQLRLFGALAITLGSEDLLAEFNYFAEERQDKEDFVLSLLATCRSRAEDYEEQADRLEMLLTDLRSKNSYECGDRPKINY